MKNKFSEIQFLYNDEEKKCKFSNDFFIPQLGLVMFCKNK